MNAWDFQLRAALEASLGATFLPGYEYRDIHDFALREGTWFGPQTRHSLLQGAPRMCFGNAIVVAVIKGLRYCEGFAMNAFAQGLPVHHAWNLDEDGAVVDVTWGAYENSRLVEPIGLSYCGVVFSVERADEATWVGDGTVIDDYNRRWPLLKEKWNGEPEGLTWPPSPRLAALSARRDGRHADMLAALAEVEL